MKRFPFLTQAQSIIVLRYTVAIMFLAHAGVRVYNHTLEGFGTFLDNKGFVMGYSIVIVLTIFELVGGVLLALGYFTKWLSAGFIFILVVGIIIIHAQLGWFVGEHGEGGVEYSLALIAALLVIAAFDQKKSS